MRVFLDANILFSGAASPSRMRALLLLLADQAELVTSAYAVEEARRNPGRKWPEHAAGLDGLLERCEVHGVVLADVPVKLAAKDVPILAGAIAAQATHLLTGDEADFGHLFGRTVAGVKVVPPARLAAELTRLGWL